MLEQVLTYLNNWFIAPGGIHNGKFRIENGGITLPFLRDGQYFRVVGSVFNDGLHAYPVAGMVDEEFTGTIWALAIPRSVMELSTQIEKWNEKNWETASSPFVSESFGGYSYTKANSGGSPVGWQSVFSVQLAQYRKLREYDAIPKGESYEFT